MKENLKLLVAISFLIINFGSDIYAQTNDVQLYGFIHSLVVHEPPIIPVPNNETTAIYWINDIATNNNLTFSFTGQFGQMPSHVDQLPPNDNIGFPSVASPWDSSTGQTFETSSINTIISTAANFIQWDLPINPDPADPMYRSIVENTETLFDWTNNQKPNMRYYIYGNWPEMDNENSFPPTIPSESEINEFHNITIGNIGTFDDWWTEYQDALTASRPLLEVKLIPVGRIISQIYTQLIPNQIPFDELYEDSAPHGRANTYFLAGSIVYMALYKQKIPVNYMPSEIIHPVIRENLQIINEFIWNELNEFNFSNGESRVFYSTPLSNSGIEISTKINISPNPVNYLFTIEAEDFHTFNVSVININGTELMKYENLQNGDAINMSKFADGTYFIHFTTNQNHTVTKKIIKQ